MTGHTDVAGVVAHYRALVRASEEATQASTGSAVGHMLEHLRDVSSATGGDRATQLRVIGEGLLVACLVHTQDMQARYPGVQMVQPLLTIEVLVGLRLVDEAFALATGGEGS